MAAKNRHNTIDCLAAALPDEEYFVLLARDPLAPWLVAIWASMRVGNVVAAADNFRLMGGDGLLVHYRAHPDEAKSTEAVNVAQKMAQWRADNINAGPDGQPSWKSSLVRPSLIELEPERFAIEWGERAQDGEVTIIRLPTMDRPTWVQTYDGSPCCPRCHEITCECPTYEDLQRIAGEMMALADNMLARAGREDVDMKSEDHGFDLEAMDQYAAKLRGFAGQLVHDPEAVATGTTDVLASMIGADEAAIARGTASRVTADEAQTRLDDQFGIGRDAAHQHIRSDPHGSAIYQSALAALRVVLDELRECRNA